MDTFETAFKLIIRGFGRAFADHHELMNKSDMDVWKLADKFISSRTYNLRNEQILLKLDWKSAIQHIEFWHEVESSSEKIKDLMNNQLSKPEEIDPVQINITLIMPAKLKDDKHKDIRYEYIIHFIHEIFLIMNLASPGCCNFEYSTISTIDNSWSESIHLSSFLFENGWQDSIKNSWPKVTSFPLNIVFEWFNALDIGNHSIATTSISKALFALLHVAHDLMGEPASLVWLAHALESLYDTPPTLSYAFLKRRIIEFLHIPAKKEKWLNKKLRQFYDDRNSFVHGGMPIAHPIAIGMDDGEDNYYEKLYDAIGYGSLFVISTLQEYITRRWKNIVYEEKVSGIII
ncbi:MAG: hypothetical protein ACYC6G_10690 [Desulfobaccales bacterium]